METPVEKPEVAGTPQYMPSGPECHQILAVARTCACRTGMQREDCEDLAMNFLAHLLSYLERHPETDPSLVLSPAWLALSASNWTKNALRTQRRRQHCETAWPSGCAEEEDEANPAVELPSNAPSPFQETVREEFLRRLQCAISDARLTRSQRALLEPLLAGERAVDIARRTGRSADTVRHGLKTLRGRLRASLNLHGLGDADVAEFLSHC